MMTTPQEGAAMSYRYRCPLCLTRLGAGQRLVVFKRNDPTAARPGDFDRIDCSDPNFVERIIDFGGKGGLTPTEENAVFVSHMKCTATNPFWDEVKGKVDMPGDPNEGGNELAAEFECSRTGQTLQKQLKHWIVGMLRTAADRYVKHRPMWYTFPLLLATAAENEEDLERPFGSLVEIASTKDVGKTILTLQLLNDILYQNGRSLNVSDYFYPKTDFKEELYFRSTWQDRPTSRPAATLPTPGDMRAVFVAPINASPFDEPVNGNGLKPSRWQSFVRKTREGAAYFLESTFGSMGEEQKQKETFDLSRMMAEKRHLVWKPVLFYDTAGELQARRAQIIQSVSQTTNKLAICIDARDVFDIDSISRDDHNASIKHACGRINNMLLTPHRQKATCIIVTKLDMVDFTPEQREQVRRIAEDVDVNDDEAREMLVDWLKAHSDNDKRKLIGYLRRSDHSVERVFFVWTENLPKMRGIRFSPINKFVPTNGNPGDEITITANAGFNFQDAKEVFFNGLEADFDIVSDTQIKARVPQGATSGYIDIVLEVVDPVTNQPYNDDPANSDGIFNVGKERSPDVGMPRSCGLVKFLAWCLDQSVEAITLKAQV
jgi:IPT/TIG domain-containing protein